MGKPKISIIVPMYNVEKYICQCASSLFGQTYDNMEYVFVDDCSNDGTVRNLKDCLSKYPQRKEQVKILFNGENRGVAFTRNVGLRNATGDYIGWCDSDDWVEADMFEGLLESILKANADLAYCHYFEEGCSQRTVTVADISNPDKEKRLCGYLEKGPNTLWNKLTSRKLYADGQLNINGEEKKEQTDMENKPEKKRRGRPRKNSVVMEENKIKENTVAEEKAEYTPKKRRGRPRKNPPVETVKQAEETVAKKPRKRVNKIAAMAQSIKTAEQKAAEVENTENKQKEEAKPAKRRGRPRKNPTETPVTKVEAAAPKKRRGRPRKNAEIITSTVTEEVSSIPVQTETTAKAAVPAMPKEQEAEINERPITALVKAINRLTRQVDSLKRLVAGKKKVNY